MWKYVGWHLAKKGIESILVGGAVAAIYSKGAYKSGDLDLITYEQTRAELDDVMESIGFERKDMHYVHPECDHLYVQSLYGPLGIGDDMQIVPKEIVVEKKVLKLYSPTDCIRDRISTYLYHRSRTGLDQAAMVAVVQPFSSKKVKDWLIKEGSTAVYEEFLEAVRRFKKHQGGET